MSQGINGFSPLSAARINQQFAQQLHLPSPIRENSFGSPHMSLFQQQQSPLLVTSSPINENVFGIMQRPKCDASTMIQVSQQFNQFTQQQSPHTPRKPLPLFSLQGHDQLPMNIESVFKTPMRVDPNFTALCELQEIATSGCESAAKIYPSHSKRPYFKKIDLLCDRLRQDLRVTDKAVVNINSHGVAWAIKDFIFVFTRITSAWVIMRDYYYTKSEGMNCVKESIDPNLAKDFLEWQEATKNFCKSLQKSFENLQYRDQQNGNRRGQSSGSKLGGNESSPANGHKSFQRLFDPLVIENSERAQLEGGYLKSALYHPISSETSSQLTPSSSNEFVPTYDSIETMLDDLMSDHSSPEQDRRVPPLYKRCAEAPLMSQKAVKSQYRMKASAEEKMKSVSFDLEGISPMKSDEQNEEDLFAVETMQRFYGIEGAKKISDVLNGVLCLRGALIFLNPNESLKCFPTLQLSNALSLELVINNVKSGKYPTIREVFIALKMISEQARALLFRCQEADQSIGEMISEFISGVELILAKHA